MKQLIIDIELLVLLKIHDVYTLREAIVSDENMVNGGFAGNGGDELENG